MSTTPLSQFLLRQLTLIENQTVLVCGQLQNIELSPLIETINPHVLITDFSVYQKYSKQYPQAHLHWQTTPDTHWSVDSVLLFFPKAKQEALFWLQQAVPALKPGGTLYIAGENNGGIKSAASLLKSWSLSLQKADSAKHCQLLAATIDHPIPAPELTFKNYLILQDNQPITISALPGVFSANELDDGTQLLLEALPPLSGKVLDMGCGAGVIGSVLAKRHPTIDLLMSDVSLLAILSAQQTLQNNELTASVIPSDMFSTIDGQFDYIISNPPFHAGLKTHYGATERFLAESKQHLTAGGHLYIVANRFLPYENILKQSFSNVQIERENGRFKIIHAY